jgi:hypothetical protein
MVRTRPWGRTSLGLEDPTSEVANQLGSLAGIRVRVLRQRLWRRRLVTMGWLQRDGHLQHILTGTPTAPASPTASALELIRQESLSALMGSGNWARRSVRGEVCVKVTLAVFVASRYFDMHRYLADRGPGG